MHYLFTLLLILLAPFGAAAADNQPSGTRISLSATATAEVANDEVVITFRIEKEGKDADEIRTYVNRVSRTIQKRLQREKGVKLKTIGRNMQPVWQYPKNRQRIRVAWRMTQTEQVSSKNLDAVPRWLQAIESEGANLSNLQFRISRKSSTTAQERLRLEAVSSFRSKAASLAKGLDGNRFRIIRLNTSSRIPQPVTYRREMAMMAADAEAAAPPALSAGENSLQITVSGEIELPFTDFPVK